MKRDVPTQENCQRLHSSAKHCLHDLGLDHQQPYVSSSALRYSLALLHAKLNTIQAGLLWIFVLHIQMNSTASESDCSAEARISHHISQRERLDEEQAVVLKRMILRS